MDSSFLSARNEASASVNCIYRLQSWSAVPACRLAAQQRVLVLEGATLIDATGRNPIADGVVVVEGSRIKAVGAMPEPLTRHSRNQTGPNSAKLNHGADHGAVRG